MTLILKMIPPKPPLLWGWECSGTKGEWVRNWKEGSDLEIDVGDLPTAHGACGEQGGQPAEWRNPRTTDHHQGRCTRVTLGQDEERTVREGQCQPASLQVSSHSVIVPMWEKQAREWSFSTSSLSRHRKPEGPTQMFNAVSGRVVFLPRKSPFTGAPEQGAPLPACSGKQVSHHVYCIFTQVPFIKNNNF